MAARSYDRLKNYSTTVSVEKTVMEIERMLAKSGAKRVLKEFGPDGSVTSLAFTIDTANGEMPVRLPARVDRVVQIFKTQATLPKRYRAEDWAEKQAARAAWRTIKDWLDAQLSLISMDMVKIDEIFLPYAYSARMGKTLYEAVDSGLVDISNLLGDGQ